MIGQTLGHFRILEQIGAGGMGIVYRARDKRLDRDVALKVLPAGALADDAARKRFRKEALALAKLAHPNIGMVFDFDTQDGVDFLAMEYVAGRTLAERLGTGSLPEREVVALGAQIAAALEEAHEQGIVHRDLKPGNILVTPKGQAKVLDFGLAKLLGAQGDAGATQTFTETQGVAGTLPYMAPEQLRSETLDGRTDIYALGCVLYEMATGRRAFPEDSAPRLTDAILHQAPVGPRAVNGRVSPQLEAIILKCLEKDPENRYQSAKEASVDLRRLALPTAASGARPTPARMSWRKMGIGAAAGVVAILLLLVALNVAGLRERLLGKSSATLGIRSLAVLPLENFSHNAELEYFADGMTEALITDLAQISALKVISRTSVMHYKGTRKTLPEIARELNVDAVVEGSVQRSGDRVRITAQLIRAPTDTHLWAHSYERDLRDVLALENEVAQAIASEVKVKLTPEVRARLASARPVNPEAYEAYLKGRYFWNKRTEEAFKKAIEQFNQAIEKDPNYALGYAGLADSYYTLGNNGYRPPRETCPKARATALKALELDDRLAEPHTTLAMVLQECDFDWAGAEKEVKRAIELNPGYANAHHWFAWYLARTGRPEESIAEIKRAQEADPLSLIINTNLARMLYQARHYDQAIEQLRKTLEMDPNFAWAHWLLGIVYEQKGMYEESVVELQNANILPEINTIRFAGLGRAYARAGRKKDAIRILEQLKALSKQRYVEATGPAMIYAGLGDKDQAFVWLEKAFDERSIGVPAIKVDARYDSLRSDPRFQDLLRRMGLPP